MTDTPLCNQCFEEAQDFHKSALVVPLDFARQLERELNAAKAALSGRTVSCSNCNAMAEELAAMKKAVPTNTP